VYAVIEDSGQQFRVSEGDVLNVDLRDITEDATTLEFDRVLLVGSEDATKVGTPYVDGAKVVANIVEAEFKGKKVQHFTLRRRKASKRKVGHRQRYIRVKIAKIEA
jgi:large subunit ribosomal protein L21